MKLRIAVVVIVLSFLAVPVQATGIDFFTVSGTVLSISYGDPPPPDRDMPPVLLELGVFGPGAGHPALGSGGYAFRTAVGCYDPEVAAACLALEVGDAVMIAGIEVGEIKEATHVALLVHATDDCVACNFAHMVVYDGLMVKFVRVAEDTRCPADLTCPAAGRVVVELGLWMDKIFLGTHKLTLGEGAGPDRMEMWPYVIRLAEVLPVPSTDIMPIDPADCSMVLQVAKSISKDREGFWFPMK